jgi:hypothetical protein
MSDQSPPAPLLALPTDVNERLKYWRGKWYESAQVHYFCGVVSVGASVISTSLDGGPAKAFSILAAISTALIGFVHPERRYVKFVRAWRVLDLAAMRYRHGLLDKAKLIEAVGQGEALLAEFEDRYSDGGKAHDAALAAAAASAAVAATNAPAPEPSTEPPPGPAADEPSQR